MTESTTQVKITVSGERENVEAFCRRVRNEARLYEIRFDRATTPTTGSNMISDICRGDK